MSQNSSVWNTDGKQIEMLLDDLIGLYCELRKMADEYTDLHGKDGNNDEALKAANGLKEFKSAFDKTCTAAVYTLNEVKNRGYLFEIKVVPV